ncbi:hypothetical protein CCZ01_04270 [Helicobacter monodelphidis]|uniref:hypothetical protein n=1 Tax=Helicobacter sp. 15-1451 TaxID=2004995 RepID=UPI000DCB2CED|nr:hypothetical protein [Helicobacter sp. 15-1451]RAX58029.1 hypothetical protein CCZ01_04270 [Helicobacter sp. 15-1451]
MQNNLMSLLDFEYQKLGFYQQLANIFGVDSCFGQLSQATTLQVNAALFLIQNQGLSYNYRPLNQDSISSQLIENLEKAFIFESNTIQLCNQWLSSEQDANVRDFIFRIQALAYNSHIPLIRKNMVNVYQQNSSIQQESQVLGEVEKAQILFSQTNEMIEELRAGTLTQEKLGGFLSNLNYSLIGGVILGGISAMILNEILNKNKE